MSLLSMKDVSLSFGGVKAVQDVSFAVEEGEVFSSIAICPSSTDRLTP